MRSLVALLVVALVASCSTDESPPSNSPALGGTVGVPTVDESNLPAPPPVAPGEDGTVPDPAAPADEGLGSCQVALTGDVLDEWAADATVESVTYGPWLSPRSVEAATENSVVVDASLLVLNCRSTGARGVSVVALGAVPQRPNTYRLRVDPQSGAASPRNRLDVVLSLDRSGVCRLSGDGRVELVTFDERRIAGTFDATVTCPDGEVVRAAGRFDFANPEPLLVPPTTG